MKAFTSVDDGRIKYIKRCYYNAPSWCEKVDKMSSKQILGIYLSLKQRDKKTPKESKRKASSYPTQYVGKAVTKCIECGAPIYASQELPVPHCGVYRCSCGYLN